MNHLMIKIVNITIDDYVIKAIDYSITKWINDDLQNQSEVGRGQLEAFLAVLNSNDNFDLNNYILLYNFYDVMYNIISSSLPMYVNTEEWRHDDEDGFPTYTVEDFINIVITQEEADDDDIYQTLASGNDDYKSKLSMEYDTELYVNFVNKAFHHPDYKYKKNLIELEDNISDEIKGLYTDLGLNQLFIFNDLVDATSAAIWSNALAYSLVSLYEEKSSMLLFILGKDPDININDILNTIAASIRSTSTMVIDPFKYVVDNISDLLANV